MTRVTRGDTLAATTTIESIARWAAELRADRIPAEVRTACRAQRRSVLAAIAASADDAASRRVLAGVRSWARSGPAPDFTMRGTGGGVLVEDSLYAAAALSVALDFDDYQCFGHTGHSAVLVPILLAAEIRSSGEEQLAAQAAAAEVAARLGGACLIGPLNGQLWSFLHSAGAALAAGRLLGLSAEALAHALALALYQAHRPTVPGFMAPDSKLLTAAEPALAGLRAARLAAAGVTGPLDALDHPQGFLSAFSYAPLPGMLGGLGEGWALRTLSVKPYPGCAYIDTTIDALLALGPPPAGEVEQVVIDASLPAIGMNAMSDRYAAGGAPTPVTVNFSLPWNVAIALHAGRLTPAELRADRLATDQAAHEALARRVVVRHDWDLTRKTAERFAALLPVRAILDEVELRALGRAVRRMQAEQPDPRLGRIRLRDLARTFARAPAALGQMGVMGGARFWAPEALAGFTMTFPARVRVRTRDGRELVATAEVPRGGAGHETHPPERISREKLRAWGPLLWGERAEAIERAIDRDAADLHTLLTPVAR